MPRATAPMTDAKSKTENNDELQAILTQQADSGICLLRDSPFRILRVRLLNDFFVF